MTPAVVAALPQNVQEGLRVFSGLADTHHFENREQFLAHRAEFVRARRDLGESLRAFRNDLRKTPEYRNGDPATLAVAKACKGQSRRLHENDILTEQITQMTLRSLPRDPKVGVSEPISVSFQELSAQSRALASANPRAMSPNELDRAAFLTQPVYSSEGSKKLGGGKSGNAPFVTDETASLEDIASGDSPLMQGIPGSNERVVKQAARFTTRSTKAEKGMHMAAGRIPYTSFVSFDDTPMRVEDGLREVATQATAEILGLQELVAKTTLARDVQAGAAFAMEKAPGTPAHDWVYAPPGGREAMEGELREAQLTASRLGENRAFVKERFRQIEAAGQDPEKLFGVSESDLERWGESQRFASKQVAEFTPHFTQQLQQIQIVDIITGQKDRHPGNFFVFRDGNDFGARTIDNSGAFETIASRSDREDVATVAFPVVDQATYELVNSIDPDVIENRLVGMADATRRNRDEVFPSLRERLSVLQAHFKTLNDRGLVHPELTTEDAKAVYESMRVHRDVKPIFLKPGEIAFAKKDLSGPGASAFRATTGFGKQAAIDVFTVEGVAAAADAYVKHHRLGTDYERSLNPPGTPFGAREKGFGSFGENVRFAEVYHAVRGVRQSQDGTLTAVVKGGEYSKASAPTPKQAEAIMHAIAGMEAHHAPLKPWEIREAVVGGISADGSDVNDASTRKKVREVMSRLEHHFPNSFKMPGSSAKVSQVYDVLRNHRGFGGGMSPKSTAYALDQIGERMQERYEFGGRLSDIDIRAICIESGASEKEADRVAGELGKLLRAHEEPIDMLRPAPEPTPSYEDRFQRGAFTPPVPAQPSVMPGTTPPPTTDRAQGIAQGTAGALPVVDVPLDPALFLPEPASPLAMTQGGDGEDDALQVGAQGASSNQGNEAVEQVEGDALACGADGFDPNVADPDEFDEHEQVVPETTASSDAGVGRAM
jgi:hypothetical protein